MPDKPVAGQPGGLVKGAGFIKEVGCAGDNLHYCDARFHFAKGLAVQGDNLHIITAYNQ
jgi:hypothetical protein